MVFKMKKITLFLVSVFLLAGCAHNESMAKIEKARWDAYGTAMAAYYANLPSHRGEIVDLQVDETGKLSGLKVYASDMKPLPMPQEPTELKPWGAQMLDSGSEMGITAIQWGAGLMAIKIVTDNAGHNTTGSHNQTSTDNSVATSESQSSEVGDTITQTNTDKSMTDSGNSQSSTQESNYTDSYKTDNSVTDGYNQDTDNSIKDSYGQDNRENYNNSTTIPGL